jgi:hypothetical protein
MIDYDLGIMIAKKVEMLRMVYDDKMTSWSSRVCNSCLSFSDIEICKFVSCSCWMNAFNQFVHLGFVTKYLRDFKIARSRGN